MVIQVEAFNLKNGPTESGTVPNGIPMDRIPEAVGGELLPFDVLKAIPPHVLLLLIFAIPAVVLLYKKRDYALNLLANYLF
ncbi:hypothetical protein GF319_11490 [Candidatus Bathyarchaeota archaeon]|nr:hypothetical protein [Candidatus Bathyarchaeota archaeon]